MQAITHRRYKLHMRHRNKNKHESFRLEIPREVVDDMNITKADRFRVTYGDNKIIYERR